MLVALVNRRMRERSGRPEKVIMAATGARTL